MALNGLKLRHQQYYVSSRGSSENLLLCLLLLLKADSIPWFVASYSIFKVSSIPSYSFSLTLLLSSYLLLWLFWPCFFLYKESCNYIEPIWIIQVYSSHLKGCNLITSAESFLLEVLGIRMWSSFGEGIILLITNANEVRRQKLFWNGLFSCYFVQWIWYIILHFLQQQSL